jgi:hypothetical protein
VTAFKLAIGAAALWPALFLLAAQRDAPPPVALPDQIAERWPPEIPVAPKADRLSINEPAPIYVAKPEPTPQPMALATAADIEQSRTEKPHIRNARAHARNEPASERNICTRHGMHKVETHGGRSWRCRR